MDANKKQTILLVEDDFITAEVEIAQLKQRGYNIVHAANGETAIELIDDENNEINLILMDIDLGSGMDGTEAAAIILTKKDIPVVFLSSHNEPDIVEKTEKISSYGYVLKNTGITVLDASIKMAFKLFNANKELLIKELLLQSIAENYPNSYVSIINADYTIGFSSGQGFKKLNLDPEQFIGMSIEQVFGEHAEIVMGYYQKTFQGEECSFELFINNQHQIYSTVPLVSENGTVQQILAVAENITEKKMIEIALQESNEQFSQFMDYIPAGVFIKDSDYNAVYVNKYMKEKFNAETWLG